MILRENTFSPRMSDTANIMVMSLMPTNGPTSPEAAVESMTLGKPYGRAWRTGAHVDVPWVPPSVTTPWIASLPMRSRSVFLAPSVTNGPDVSRLGLSRRFLSEPPPFSMTFALEMSALMPASPTTPMSMIRALPPRDSISSRIRFASAALVSSVAKMAITFDMV